MSMQYTETITCPECGKQGEVVLWRSINTVIDPDMKEKVRNGEAFQWTCPECGYTTGISYNTLYHQMEDQVMIFLAFGDEREKAIEMMQSMFDADGKDEIALDLSITKDYKRRVVDSVNSLREKIMILDSGLDDRVIELMKLFLVTQLMNNDDTLQIEEFLFECRPEGNVFAVYDGNNGWGTVDFDREIYDLLAARFSDAIEADQAVVIDQNWALNLLGNS